jgi:hypothetical protein
VWIVLGLAYLAFFSGTRRPFFLNEAPNYLDPMARREGFDAVGLRPT